LRIPATPTIVIAATFTAEPLRRGLLAEHDIKGYTYSWGKNVGLRERALELGTLGGKAATAVVGIAPFPDDSPEILAPVEPLNLRVVCGPLAY
jgi:hypothetical protein